ncbi:MAG TPA: malto-oligosyltrehalose synthase, partial [Acidimicrobiia bacterium]|nr:malto-oligosyltrehalose synthase [Acidimicrobiia bacterium]
VTEAALLDVVVEITVAMPRYRTYLAPGHVSAEDRVVVKTVTQAALDAGCDPEAVKITRDVLLHDVDQPGAAEWVVAWQQFTPAVAAKGVEDTALYRYHAHEALNVVGGDPDVVPSDPVGRFHRYCEERAGRPSRAGLNATSTHDTKRSEDVRCRIDVLSELSHSWPRLLRRFSRLTAVHRRDLGDRVAPDRVDESLVYQVLLGAWPLSGDELPEFRDRLAAYLVKAARESKRHTSWLDPDESYEAALTNFAAGLFEDQEFRAAFEPLQRKVASAGAVNSLAEVVCKVAAPGAPDVYQGTELWDLSLVDPDNRRRVDLDHRVRLLAQLDAEEREAGGERLARRLLGEWHDGAVKLFVLSRAMRARRERPEIFVTGRYSPLRASGRRSDHVVAFARAASDGATAVTVVPRLVARWTGPGRLPVGRWWATTAVELPEDGPTEWVDALTGRRVRSVDGRIALADLLRNLPVAIALSE